MSVGILSAFFFAEWNVISLVLPVVCVKVGVGILVYGDYWQNSTTSVFVPPSAKKE